MARALPARADARRAQRRAVSHSELGVATAVRVPGRRRNVRRSVRAPQREPGAARGLLDADPAARVLCRGEPRPGPLARRLGAMVIRESPLPADVRAAQYVVAPRGIR